LDELIKLKINEVITHDFTKLLAIAGLKSDHDAALAVSAAGAGAFVGNWGIVSSWNSLLDLTRPDAESAPMPD
jgi:hypothetical protein